MFYRNQAIAILVAAMATGFASLNANAANLDSVTTGSIPPGGVANDEVMCLSDAIQHEPRQTMQGAVAVASVIFARARSGKFGGRSVCDVVHAYKVPVHKPHRKWSDYMHSRNPPKSATPQFSFTQRKVVPWKNPKAGERQKWLTFSLPMAKKLYHDFMTGRFTVMPELQRKLHDCTQFHSADIKPKWQHYYRYKGTYGGLLMYAAK